VNHRLGVAAEQEDKKKNRNTYPPWAMAPIVSATKPAATTIATFNSIDNFIISPSIMAATSPPLLLIFPFFNRLEPQRVGGCPRQTAIAEGGITPDFRCADNLLYGRRLRFGRWFAREKWIRKNFMAIGRGKGNEVVSD